MGNAAVAPGGGDGDDGGGGIDPNAAGGVDSGGGRDGGSAGSNGNHSGDTSIAELRAFVVAHPSIGQNIRQGSISDLDDLVQALCQPMQAELGRKLARVEAIPVASTALLHGALGSPGQWPEKVERIQELTEWVVQNISHAAASQKLQLSLRRVLGNFNYARFLFRARCWGRLRKGCEAHLKRLGGMLETREYQQLRLREEVGAYSPRVRFKSEWTHGTLDPAFSAAGGGDGSDESSPGREPTQLVPEQLRRLQRQHQQQEQNEGAGGSSSGTDGGGGSSSSSSRAARTRHLVDRHRLECTYIHFLRLLGRALDASFQTAVNRAVGSLLVEGRVESHGIKGFARMLNKCTSAADHGHKPFPRPQFNLDVVRCLATFNNGRDMLAGMRRLEERFGGGFVKFKNGMEWSEEFAASRYGLRTVLISVDFEHPILRTIGQLRGNRSIRTNAFSRYLATERVAAPQSRSAWRADVQRAVGWIDMLPAATPVSMVCEVQCVLRSYRDTRHRMHEAYRVVRATGPVSLHTDFKKYDQQARDDAERARSGKSRFHMACRDGALDVLETLLPRSQQQPHEQSSSELKPRKEEGQQRESTRKNKKTKSKKRQFNQAQLVDGLDIACCFVRRACVEFLLSHVADVNCSGADGRPPLAAACRGARQRWQFSLDADRVEIVRMLLQRGADVNKRPAPSLRSPAFLAARSGFGDVLRLLLAAKADADAPCTTGATPLWVAAHHGHHDVVMALLQHGALADARNERGETPFYTAARGGHIEVLALLLQDLSLRKGALDPATPTLDGATPLHAAATQGSPAGLELLLLHLGHCVDTPDGHGQTPLMQATLAGQPDCVQLLLDAKAAPLPAETVAAVAAASRQDDDNEEEEEEEDDDDDKDGDGEDEEAWEGGADGGGGGGAGGVSGKDNQQQRQQRQRQPEKKTPKSAKTAAEKEEARRQAALVREMAARLDRAEANPEKEPVPAQPGEATTMAATTTAVATTATAVPTAAAAAAAAATAVSAATARGGGAGGVGGPSDKATTNANTSTTDEAKV